MPLWKCTEFGYDGNGVKLLDKSDLDELPNVECIAEEMIPLKNELWLLCAEIHQEK
jgi:5-(carboxyamino)imidazole ribonucleotide synthase